MRAIRSIFLAVSLALMGAFLTVVPQDVAAASNCYAFPNTPYNSGWSIVVSGS